MNAGRSHLSTMRALSEDAAGASAHASALAEMDAAISNLGDWQRQRELDIARLKVRMMRDDRAAAEANHHNCNSDKIEPISSSDSSLSGDSCAAWARKILTEINSSDQERQGGDNRENDSCGAFLTAAMKARSDILNNDDDDPVSRAYEDRLRAELAALQNRREELERQSCTPRDPSSLNLSGNIEVGSARSYQHHMPTELLISRDQIEELTKDTRSHVGEKSVVALRSEVRDLEVAAFDKQLRADQSVVTDPELLNEEDVTRVATEEHGFREVLGLGNVLSEYMSGLDDMMLKLDAVDAAIEASQLSSRRSASRDDREERDDNQKVGVLDVGEGDEDNTTCSGKAMKPPLRKIPAAPDGLGRALVGLEQKEAGLVPESL